MDRIVVDASVVLKGFAQAAERHHDQALSLFEDLEHGRVAFVGPELLLLEVLNTAARKWQMSEASLDVLAVALRDMKITLHPVDIRRAAAWSGLGLSAYDAAYVAVAEELQLSLLTDDDQILALAPGVAVSIATYADRAT